jgi:hypothetical protein
MTKCHEQSNNKAPSYTLVTLTLNLKKTLEFIT